MKRLFLIAWLFFSSVTVLCSGGETLLKNPEVASNIVLLEKWIVSQMESRDLPGLAIAVVHDQDLVWSRGFGYADLESKTPMTPKSIFRMASITKTFTSTAIMILRDRGKLDLDDPVAKFLPWFSYENRFPDGPPVTIRHLLTHTSGLPRESAFPYWTDHQFPSRRDIIIALHNQQNVYEPETKLKYSNLGMAILGEVVEAASGEPYFQFVQKSILDPLMMSSTSVYPPDELGPQFVRGYGRRFPDGTRSKSDRSDFNGLTAAAGISSSAEDMARYLSFHLCESKPGKQMVLKPGTLREMHRVQWLQPSWKSGWGLGFSVTKGDERTTFGHGGWVAGNRSQITVSPKEKVGVVVMVNADDGVPALFANRALSMLAPAIARAAKEPEPAAKWDPAWQKYVGRYTDTWGWDTEIMRYGEKLVMYGYGYPPEDDPTESVIELTPEGKDVFRMTGANGSGELVFFEFNPDGTLHRIKAEENYLYPKKSRN